MYKHIQPTWLNLVLLYFPLWQSAQLSVCMAVCVYVCMAVCVWQSAQLSVCSYRTSFTYSVCTLCCCETTFERMNADRRKDPNKQLQDTTTILIHNILNV